MRKLLVFLFLASISVLVFVAVSYFGLLSGPDTGSLRIDYVGDEAYDGFEISLEDVSVSGGSQVGYNSTDSLLLGDADGYKAVNFSEKDFEGNVRVTFVISEDRFSRQFSRSFNDVNFAEDNIGIRINMTPAGDLDEEDPDEDDRQDDGQDDRNDTEEEVQDDRYDLGFEVPIIEISKYREEVKSS